MQVRVETPEKWKQPQDLGKVGLADADLLKPLAAFDPFGVWRFDIETASVYWSEDIFRIYGIEPTGGPIDVANAISAYHPDDRKMVADCIEEAIRRQSGFRYTLRLIDSQGHQHMVKATGIFRFTSAGKPELYGTFCTVKNQVLSIAVGP